MAKENKISRKHLHFIPGFCLKAYLFKVFSSDLILAIQSVPEFDDDITAIILNFLPDPRLELVHKRLQKYIEHRRKMVTYWRLNMEQPFHTFLIQFHERTFIQGWFRLIMKIEQNSRARSIYDIVIELISRKNFRMLIVTNEYIIVDHLRFDIDFPRSISLW